MTIERLKSGNYRITQMYKGKRYRFTIDHKPTQKEATLILAEKMQNATEGGVSSLSISKCIDDYIETKSNVLSPATIRAYKSM